jgi:hypothetical protein
MPCRRGPAELQLNTRLEPLRTWSRTSCRRRSARGRVPQPLRRSGSRARPPTPLRRLRSPHAADRTAAGRAGGRSPGATHAPRPPPPEWDLPAAMADANEPPIEAAAANCAESSDSASKIGALLCDRLTRFDARNAEYTTLEQAIVPPLEPNRSGAEGAGFEPAVRVNGLRFSRPVHSTALPPLRRGPAVPARSPGSERPGRSDRRRRSRPGRSSRPGACPGTAGGRPRRSRTGPPGRSPS